MNTIFGEKKYFFEQLIYKDNTLYFSSNGKIGFGGLDIFKTSFNNGVVSSSTILLEPYNSSADDFSFVPNDDNENGYGNNSYDGTGGRSSADN